jgi:hypothetical protein
MQNRKGYRLLNTSQKEIPDPMNWSEYAEYLDKQFEKEDQKKSEVKKEPPKVETWRDRASML